MRPRLYLDYFLTILVTFSMFTSYSTATMSFSSLAGLMSTSLHMHDKLITRARMSLSSMVDSFHIKDDNIGIAVGAGVSETIKKTIRDGPVPMNERKFLINGWRWHTASVLRDLGRFKSVISVVERSITNDLLEAELAATSTKKDTAAVLAILLRSTENTNTLVSRLLRCHNFVCGFNYKALLKVESELFFPWLKNLPGFPGQEFLNIVINEHVEVRHLSSQIEDICKRLVTSGVGGSSVNGGSASASTASSYILNADPIHGETENKGEVIITKLRRDLDYTLMQVRKIDALIDKMVTSAQRIKNAQQNIFVPYIAAFVSKDEQEKFNRRVIARLGLLDSQVHLVSMTEAIKDIPEELQLFRAQIPRVAQALIPVWKKRLYSAKANCLEISAGEFSSSDQQSSSSSLLDISRSLLFSG